MVTQSAWWIQLIANMFGKTVILNDTVDASSMGAAYMGMYATGRISNFEAVKQVIKIKKVFEPDNNIFLLYKKQYQAFKALYPAFKKLQAESLINPIL